MNNFENENLILEELDERIYHALRKVASGKWKPFILWKLKDGPKRFNVLLREFYPVTQATLTRQLRELEKDGMIKRIVYPEVPPRVEYYITERGTDFIPIIVSAYKWASKHNFK